MKYIKRIVFSLLVVLVIAPVGVFLILKDILTGEEDEQPVSEIIADIQRALK